LNKYSTKSVGDKAEQKATKFLKKNGHEIIELNFYAKKLGEIDIISTKNGVYHFAEVKSGKSFEAVYNITKSKLKKLYNSIDYYLIVNKIQPAYCVDAIVISGENFEFLQYIENISL